MAIWKINPGTDSFNINGIYVPYIRVEADTEQAAVRKALDIMPDLEQEFSLNCIGSIELTATHNAIYSGKPPRVSETEWLHRAIILLRHAHIRITREHFLLTYGDVMGVHIYRQFLKREQNLISLYTSLDTPSATKLRSLIKTIGE